MKIYPFLILLSLILYIQNQCEKEDEITVKKEECYKRPLSKDEKDEGDKYCCYVKLEVEGIPFEMCGAVTEEDLTNIEEKVKNIEADGEGVVKAIDCEGHPGYVKSGVSTDKKTPILTVGALALIFSLCLLNLK